MAPFRHKWGNPLLGPKHKLSLGGGGGGGEGEEEDLKIQIFLIIFLSTQYLKKSVAVKIIIENLSFMKFGILYIKESSNTFLLKLIAGKTCPS